MASPQGPTAPVPPAKTMERVLEADTAFRAREGAVAFDGAAEAAALAALFADAAACQRCQAQLGPRWAPLEAKWQAWSAAPRSGEPGAADPLGTAIQRVVEDLDAVHLKPTGISHRLAAGVDAACYGLATLMGRLADPQASEGTGLPVQR